MFIDYIDIYEEVVRTLLYPQAALYKTIEPYKDKIHDLANTINNIPVDNIPISPKFANILKFKITDMLKKIELKINKLKPKKKKSKI